jgi:hypothetical protein
LYALKTELPTLTPYALKTEADAKYALKSDALVASNYYTKTEADAKYSLWHEPANEVFKYLRDNTVTIGNGTSAKLVLDGTVSPGSDSLDDSGQIKTEITFLIDENKVEGSSQYYQIGTKDYKNSSHFFIRNEIGELFRFHGGINNTDGTPSNWFDVNEATFFTTVNAPIITLNSVDINSIFAKKTDIPTNYVTTATVDSIVANAIIAANNSESNITIVQAVETIKYLEGRIKVLEALMNQLGFGNDITTLNSSLDIFSLATSIKNMFGFL